VKMRRRTGYVRRRAGRDLHLHVDLHWIDRLNRADAARAILESGNSRDSRSAARR
jgi:hypothetical protein